jgi:hypothetical protein
MALRSKGTKTIRETGAILMDSLPYPAQDILCRVGQHLTFGKGQCRERSRAKEIVEREHVCDRPSCGSWRGSYVRQKRSKRAAKELKQFERN